MPTSTIRKANAANTGANWWAVDAFSNLVLATSSSQWALNDFAEVLSGAEKNNVYVYTGASGLNPSTGWELWGTKGGGGGGGDATASFYPNAVVFSGSFTQGQGTEQSAITTIDRSGYNDEITVKATDLPSGLSIADASIPSTDNKASLLMVYDGSTVAGTYVFTLNYYKGDSLVIYRQVQTSVNIVPQENGGGGGGGGLGGFD